MDPELDPIQNQSRISYNINIDPDPDRGGQLVTDYSDPDSEHCM
jgi:hypothetical protein